MPLGISFGRRRQSTDSTRTTNQTQTQNQSALTNQQQEQIQSSVSTALGQSTETTDTRSQQAGTSAATTQGSQTQRGQTQTFSDTVLSALESAGLGALGRTSAAGRVDTSALRNFDMGQFIADAVNQAAAGASQSRGIAQGGMFDSLGGTSRGNTMAALLDQQLGIQEAAAVAGARNQATAQAMEILRQNLGTEMASVGQDQGFMTQLLGLLQGGRQITTGEMASTQAQQTQDQRIAAQQQTEQEMQLQQQQQQQITQLTSLIAQLVRGTTNTVGTETERSTTRQSGGGIGLQL